MIIQNSQKEKKLFRARSAQSLKIDLNYKLPKKSQVKLLNAKLRKLKSKCQALREQAKNDRQMLTNLMDTTQSLQNKTNQGIQACKQVSAYMFDSSQQIQSQFSNLSQNVASQFGVQVVQQGNCSRKDNFTNVSKNQQLLTETVQILTSIKNVSDLNTMQNIPSCKRNTQIPLLSQGQTQSDCNMQNEIQTTDIQTQPYYMKKEDTISISPTKQKAYRKVSLNSNKINVFNIKESQENLFFKYIYALITVIILTITLKLAIF